MFEPEPPKEPRSADWFGTILAVVLSPVFFFFASVGKEDFGFTAYIILVVFVFAARTQWLLRRHRWFWPTVALLALVHIPLLFILQWPDGQVPTIVYTVPVGIVDFLLVSRAISLVNRLSRSVHPRERRSRGNSLPGGTPDAEGRRHEVH